jgi:nucleoside-diphosphate-sugar epimerase
MEERRIAAVTGATGIIGKRIVDMLLQEGFLVRILTRRVDMSPRRNIEVISADLSDSQALYRLLKEVTWVFHCAAELHVESQMHPTNVEGTRNLIIVAGACNVQVFCHMSSVGVIGKIEGSVANESTPCHPLNTYEKTKLGSEKIVAESNCARKIIILRPTNVVDETQPGALSLAIQPTFRNRLKLLLLGREQAHLIHAQDVAEAALFLAQQGTEEEVDNYIISLDHEQNNTVAGCCAEMLHHRSPISRLDLLILKCALPWFFPRLIRRVRGKLSNRGDLKYSSAKLLSTGFLYSLGLRGGIRKVHEHT